MKKGLADAENDLKAVQKIEGLQDVFQTVMPKALKKCKSQFEYLEKSFNDAVSEYEKTAELYAENPKIMQPEQFFDTVGIFILAVQVVVEFNNTYILSNAIKNWKNRD